MGSQVITVTRGLPGVRIGAQRAVRAGIEVQVEWEASAAACPRRERPVTTVHDRRLRPKPDAPLGDRSVTVVVRRRLRCSWDDRVFTEPEAEVGGWRRRTPYRHRARLRQAGADQPVQHIAAAAGVRPPTVERAVHDRAAATGVLPARRSVPVEAKRVASVWVWVGVCSWRSALASGKEPTSAWPAVSAFPRAPGSAYR